MNGQSAPDKKTSQNSRNASSHKAPPQSYRIVVWLAARVKDIRDIAGKLYLHFRSATGYASHVTQYDAVGPGLMSAKSISGIRASRKTYPFLI
jgi:hypothetical protein